MRRGVGRNRVRVAALATAAALALAPLSHADEIVRSVGRLTVRIDGSRAHSGGVFVVRLASRGRIGTAWALLDGRRAPFYARVGGPVALVPVPADAQAGPATLGIGLAARRGEQRIAIPVEIAARNYPSRPLMVHPATRMLVASSEAFRDARRLLGCIRAQSRDVPPGALRAPVTGDGSGYGELRSDPALPDLESRIDGLVGDRHRGIDYPVPVGTVVRAPGAGDVSHAGPLVLGGQTVVVDHGQGVVSVLQHLSRVLVTPGQSVALGTPVGLSGDSGVTAQPALQWRVYLHGVAVDPLVLASALD